VTGTGRRLPLSSMFPDTGIAKLNVHKQKGANHENIFS